MEKSAEYLNDQRVQLDDFIQALGLGSWISAVVIIVGKFLILGLLLYVLAFTFKRIIRLISRPIVRSTPFSWDDILYDNKVFDSLAYFFPVLFGSAISEFFFNAYPWVSINMEKLFNALFVLVLLQFLIRFINSITQIATDENNYRTVAIHSFSQLLKILFVALCILIIISILYNIELMAVLTSLGTLTAFIVLIFRDTILGFVSGMQLASTKMIKVGDWIAVPKHSIEGTVTEINLFSAKVENFDKTISTVPTYDLITTAVTNFEGMRQKNIRRIKHSILFNIRSFQFCNSVALERFKKFRLIHDYIEQKQRKLEDFNRRKNIDVNVGINRKRLTNIGVFRQYATTYLREHPDISRGETLMVRHLETTPYGLPLEIYCFAATSEWLDYERIQADIFDHLLTAAKEFDLEVVQAIVSSPQK